MVSPSSAPEKRDTRSKDDFNKLLQMFGVSRFKRTFHIASDAFSIDELADTIQERSLFLQLPSETPRDTAQRIVGEFLGVTVYNGDGNSFYKLEEVGTQTPDGSQRYKLYSNMYYYRSR